MCNSTRTKANTPSFDCLCNDAYFSQVVVIDPKNQTTNSLHPGQRLESCQPKDFCAEHLQQEKTPYCHDTNAQCNSGVERTPEGDFTPHKFCVCPGRSDQPLANHTHHCQSPCTTEYCSGHGHCAQDLYDEALIVCSCTDGWTGSRCQLRLGGGSRSATGLLVGTIVLSLVAVLSIVAIVVVYLKRYWPTFFDEI